MPRRWAFAAAGPLVAAVAACGEGRRDEARLAALEGGVASARASLSALHAAAAAPSAPAMPGAAPAPPRRAAGASPFPSGARPVAASGLLGADGDALRRWFGDPDLRRPEGAAEVLLFLGPGCALDVVLYAGAARNGGMRVAHAAARADGAVAVTEAECLRGIGGPGGGPGGVGDGAGRAMAAGHIGRR